ncbi:Putative lipoprotein [hydrothermal vent metagenome]|uniref:Putative lipoprotein n=1 Tax=hydrothermal vent metagenome TaxID=652676 RepID=A0A1W1C983_9ZZZZ
MSVKKIVILLGITLAMLGCASSNAGKVVRVDPREMRDTDANYGAEDLHIFVQKMVSAMLQTPVIASASQKPYLALGNIGIGVGVDEHIDTKLIKNSIRTNLIKSTRVNFIDSEYIEGLDKKDDKFIKKDYELTGNVHAIKKNTSSTVDNFYVLTLKLTDVKTSVIVWSEEKEIRKIVNQ